MNEYNKNIAAIIVRHSKGMNGLKAIAISLALLISLALGCGLGGVRIYTDPEPAINDVEVFTVNIK